MKRFFSRRQMLQDAAVGFGGVHVYVTLQIFDRNQVRQGVRGSGIDLALVFAQLGRNVVEIESGVNFLFGFSRHRLFCLQVGQAVLAKGVAHLESALAERNVVGFRSGEILQGCTD